MRTFTYTIAAGEGVSINASGSTIAVQAATAGFDIEIDDENRFEAFEAFKLNSRVLFEKVRLINTSGASNTIKVWIGEGDVHDGRFSFAESITNREEGPDLYQSGPNYSVSTTAGTLISGSDVLRKEIILRNTGASQIWVHNYSSYQTRGILLEAGDSVVLETTAAIYASAVGVAGSLAVGLLRYSL